MSAKALLEKRRPYCWVFDSEAASQSSSRTASRSQASLEQPSPSRAASVPSLRGAPRPRAHHPEDLHPTPSPSSLPPVEHGSVAKVASAFSEDCPDAVQQDCPHQQGGIPLEILKPWEASRSPRSRAVSHAASQASLEKTALEQDAPRRESKLGRDDVLFDKSRASSPKSPTLSSAMVTPKRSSRQLVRNGLQALATPLSSVRFKEEKLGALPEEPEPTFEREPVDPVVLRAMAHKHHIIFPEVMKYRAMFDQYDLKGRGAIGRHEFEQLVYECIMCPKRARLSKMRMTEFWQMVKVDERNQVSFEEFLLFYRKNVNELLRGLEY